MRHRWLIRAVLSTFLVLFVAAWIASHFQALYVRHYAASGRYLTAGLFYGYLDCAYCNNPDPFVSGWDCDHQLMTASFLQIVRDEYANSQFHCLGFTFDHHKVAFHVTAIWIPLWFPTLLSAILLLLTFRKPRPHHGFPIEPDAPSPEAHQPPPT